LRLANHIQSCDFICTNHILARDTGGAENLAITIKIDVKKNLTTKNFYNKMNKKNTLHYRPYQELLNNVFFFNVYIIK